jgi:hypothetical protein
MKEDPDVACGDRTCALCNARPDASADTRGPSTRPTPTSHEPDRSSSFEPTSTSDNATGSTNTMPFAAMPGGHGYFIRFKMILFFLDGRLLWYWRDAFRRMFDDDKAEASRTDDTDDDGDQLSDEARIDILRAQLAVAEEALRKKNAAAHAAGQVPKDRSGPSGQFKAIFLNHLRLFS